LWHWDETAHGWAIDDGGIFCGSPLIVQMGMGKGEMSVEAITGGKNGERFAGDVDSRVGRPNADRSTTVVDRV